MHVWDPRCVDTVAYAFDSGPDPDGHLDTVGIDDLLIRGTLANVCVLHTAGRAGLGESRPVVVQDALGVIEEGHREDADWLVGETTDRAAIEFQ